MHGDRGKFWELPLNEKDIEDEKHHDVMFIGLGKGNESENAGLWAKDQPEGTVDWGICLMSSMNSTTETMFLTVICGDSVLQSFEHFQKFLHSKLNWSQNRLPNRTSSVPDQTATGDVPAANGNQNQ